MKLKPFFQCLLVASLCVFWALVPCCEEEPDGCEPESTRCTVEDGEELAQVCNADESWQTSLNCSSLDWVCCEVDGGALCLPEEDCQ
ncbi:MAG: hypothetical protein GWN87_18825 [Desulfuromonadales bacterium]|nr:hypothetical protein [Desulfuromonadales bacterium]